MGIRSSKDEHANNGGPSLHPIFTNQEFERLQLLYESAKTISEITEELGLAECDEQAMAILFEHSGSNALAFDAYVDKLALLCKGTTSDMRRVLYGDGKSLMKIFELTLHVMYGPIEIDPSIWYNGFCLFVLKQKELQDGANPLLVDELIDRSPEGLQGAQPTFGLFNMWCTAMLPSLHIPLNKRLVEKYFIGVSSTGESGLTESVVTRVTKVSEILDIPTLTGLAFADDRCNHDYTLLFSSSSHGMSYDMLCKGLLGYPATTMVIIKDTEGNVFGGIASEMWEESSTFRGKPSGFLFTAAPNFEIMRSRASSASGTSNYQYLKQRGRTGQIGIGFGGDENCIRLWLNRDLDECHARLSDLTYEVGRLRVQADFKFTPLVVEAWGFGPPEARQSQLAYLNEVEQVQTDRRKVDRKQFANTGFDREMLLGKTFQAQHQVENR